MAFKPATREKAKLRMAIMGPAKSGKTYTSLKLATELAGPKGKVAFVDTEHGSASKYAGPGGFKFDVDELENCKPQSFIQAIEAAAKAGYDVVVIDSLSHEWIGKGGCLEMVDDMSAHSKSGNTFTQWKEVTPLHRAVFDTINKAPIHVICTFRVKTEYAMQEEERNGRKINKPVKVGLAPVTRDGAEYEFDILMDMDKGCGYIDHTSRCPDLQFMVVQHPGAELARIIQSWLDGESAGTMVAEEKMTRVKTDPKPNVAKDEPRPAVPVETATKAPKAETAVKPAGKPVSGVPGTTKEVQSTAQADPKPAAVAPIEKADQSGVSEQAGSDSPGITPEAIKGMVNDAKANGWTFDQIAQFVIANFKVKPNELAKMDLDSFASLHDWVTTHKPGQ